MSVLRKAAGGLLWAAVLLAAEPAIVTSPSVGAWGDAQGRVRMILGQPGAALQKLVLTHALAVSPRQGVALTPTADGEGLQVTSLLGGEPRRIAGTRLGADRVAVSADGRAIALLSNAERTVQVVHGLPQRPELATWMVPGEGSAEGLAVSDDGALVAVAVREEKEVAVYRLERAGPPVRLCQLGEFGAMRFAPDNATLIVTDRGKARLLVIEDAHGVPRELVLATAAEGLRRPGAVAVLRDGRLVAANPEQRTLLLVPRDGSAVVTVECPVVPEALEPLAGDGLFRLTTNGDRTLWLLDVTGAEWKVLFVPPVVAEEAQ